jgi:hypothetical protein
MQPDGARIAAQPCLAPNVAKERKPVLDRMAGLGGRAVEGRTELPLTDEAIMIRNRVWYSTVAERSA